MARLSLFVAPWVEMIRRFGRIEAGLLSGFDISKQVLRRKLLVRSVLADERHTASRISATMAVSTCMPNRLW